jgi:hypothetical protein
MPEVHKLDTTNTDSQSQKSKSSKLPYTKEELLQIWNENLDLQQTVIDANGYGPSGLRDIQDTTEDSLMMMLADWLDVELIHS